MWLKRLTDHICNIHILQCQNSCTSLLSIKNNRTWHGLTQANTKTPSLFAKPRKQKANQITVVCLLQIAHDLIYLTMNQFWWTFRVRIWYFPVGPAPSGGHQSCAVSEIAVSAQTIRNHWHHSCVTQTGTSSRGTYKCL